MTETAEHRADMFARARERDAAGKPRWDHHIDLRHLQLADLPPDEYDTPDDLQLLIGRLTDAIRNSSWWAQNGGEGSNLERRLAAFRYVESAGEFNAALHLLYNHADQQRAWLRTV